MSKRMKVRRRHTWQYKSASQGRKLNKANFIKPVIPFLCGVVVNTSGCESLVPGSNPGHLVCSSLSRSSFLYDWLIECVLGEGKLLCEPTCQTFPPQAQGPERRWAPRPRAAVVNDTNFSLLSFVSQLPFLFPKSPLKVYLLRSSNMLFIGNQVFGCSWIIKSD